MLKLFKKEAKSKKKVPYKPVGTVKRPQAFKESNIDARAIVIQPPKNRYNFSNNSLTITTEPNKIFATRLETPEHKNQALQEYARFVRHRGVQEYEQELAKRAKSNKQNTTQMSTMELMQKYSNPDNIVAAPILSKYNIGLALEFQATEKEKARLAREKQEQNDEARAIMIAIPEFNPNYQMNQSLSRRHYPEEYNIASKRIENYIQKTKDLTNLNPKKLQFLEKYFETKNMNEIKTKLAEIREKYGTNRYSTVQVNESEYGTEQTPAYTKFLDLLSTKTQNNSNEDAYSSYFNGGARKTHKQHKSNKSRKLSKRNVKSKSHKNRK